MWELIILKAAIYIRVSTEEQAKEGYSLAAQEERLKAYALSQDWDVVKVYREDGKSAKDLDRPQLQTMLQDIKNGLIDVVLVYRLDRLTRSVLDLYNLLEDFEKYNVKFKSATEVYDTTTATGRLFITLVAALAQWERENLAERVKMGMLKKAALGEWSGGIAPFGYEYKNGKFYIVEHEVEIVKKMFKMARTAGMDKIARILNKEGYRTRKGADFAGFTVQYIVRNPIYIGKLRFNDERYQIRKPLEEQQLYQTDIVEPIIDEDYFWELQKILDSRKEHQGKGKTGGYYFTSILKCGKCGGPMTGTLYKNNKYYRCQRRTKGSTCRMPQIKEEALTNHIINNIDKYLYNRIELQNFKENEFESKNKIKFLESELKKIYNQMEKYKIMYLNDLIDIDELNLKITDYRNKEKQLKHELTLLSNNVDEKNWSKEEIEYLVNSLPKLWELSSEEERKALIASIFDEIIVDADETVKPAPGRPKPFWIVSAV